MHRSTPLLFATLLALAACSSDKTKMPAGDAAAPGAPSASGTARSGAGGDADLGDVTNYHLTMDKVNKWYDAQRNMALKVKAMSPAERAAFDSTDISNASDNLDQMAAKIDRIPPMRDAIREAGFSTKEYATFTMAMMQSGMAAAVLKMRPKDDQDSLVREMKANKANIKFMQEHEAELTKKQQDMQAEMQRLGVGEKEGE